MISIGYGEHAGCPRRGNAEKLASRKAHHRVTCKTTKQQSKSTFTWNTNSNFKSDLKSAYFSHSEGFDVKWLIVEKRTDSDVSGGDRN